MKRRSALDAAQMGFTFDPPSRAKRAADLAGLDRRVAAAVGRVLKDDRRSREEIAGAMSALLDEAVTKMMLDAYASEAREGHNISAARLFAMIAVTERFDVLDALVRPIGAALLIGEEILTARAGHLRSQIRHLSAELKATEQRTAPIRRGRCP